MRRKALASVIGFSTILLSLCGCGSSPKTVQVAGQVVKNGTPFKAPENVTLMLQFQVVDTNLKVPTFSAQVDPATGQFEIIGPTGEKGIIPGEYKISVDATIYGKNKDLFNGSYQGDNTPFHHTFTAEPNQRLTIDVAKKTVSNQ